MTDNLTNGLSLADHKSEASVATKKRRFPAGEEFIRYLDYQYGSVCYAMLPQFNFGIIGALLGLLGKSRDRNANSEFLELEFNDRKNRTRAGELESIQRFSVASRPILIEIIHNELTTNNKDNHLPLIVLSSILFEREMSACLCERIRSISGEINEEIKVHRSNFDTEALEAWTMRRTETTIAILVMLLHGIRWGLQRGNAKIRHQIEDVFDSRLLDVLTNKSFALAANRIREDFQNPSLHGRKTIFTQEEYEQLSKLIISAESFPGLDQTRIQFSWGRCGSFTKPYSYRKKLSLGKRIRELNQSCRK